MKGAFERLDAAVARSLDLLCMALVGGLFVLVALVVAMRLSGLGSPAWSDEIVELMLAWLIFIGAAALWRRGEHFRVDLLEQMSSNETTRARLGLAVEALSVVFLAVLTYYGSLFAWSATDTSPTFAVPRVIWFSALPVSSALMLAYSVIRLPRIVARAAGRR